MGGIKARPVGASQIATAGAALRLARPLSSTACRRQWSAWAPTRASHAATGEVGVLGDNHVSPRRPLSHRYVQAHIDIAAGGVRVGAHLVCGVHQCLGLILFQAWQADIQVDVQTEATRDLADAYVGGDRCVSRDAFLGLTCDKLQGADEAGRVARREQLLGVGCFTARSAKFLGGCQFHVQNFIAGDGAAITATGSGCDCGIERFNDSASLGIQRSRLAQKVCALSIWARMYYANV